MDNKKTAEELLKVACEIVGGYGKWQLPKDYRYKGHKVEFDVDDDGDRYQFMYYVTPPGGKMDLADVSSYEKNHKQLIELFIDAGMPEREVLTDKFLESQVL